MSNRAAPEAGLPGAGLCRIGERVFLAPGEAADAATRRISLHAVRQMNVEAGSRSFRLFQLPRGFDVEPGVEAGIGPDLPAFLEQCDLQPADRLSFLVNLYGTAARMLRLLSDPVFIAATRALSDAEPSTGATMLIDLVGGCDTAIATLPGRSGFSAGDILVSLSGEALAIASLDLVVEFLARENPRQKLATAIFSGVPQQGEYLVIGARGPLLVNASIRSHEDPEAFQRACAVDNPDKTALLAQADEDAATVLGVLARRASSVSAIEQPLLGFQFTLAAGVGVENGLFLSGWFYDPDGLIETVVAVDHSVADPEVSATWKLGDGQGEIFGRNRPGKRFFAFLPRVRATHARNPVTLRVSLRNGENHLVTAPLAPQDLLGRRELILDSLAGRSMDEDLLGQVFEPLLAPIQSTLNARQSVRHVKEFGVRSSRSVSIVIPLYKQTGFIRSQLTAFAVDPYVAAHCELVYVLDDPLIASEVTSLFEGAASYAFPLDIKLVTLERNGGYALANNMAVGEAEGDTLVLMNSDVVPVRNGWLETALERLAALPAFSVIGPKLLYADGSLQHAGMYFDRLSSGFWQNFHFWKGYGRNFAPAERERIVPAVTGACMFIRRADYLTVGGFTADYIVGDYEDSDLCLKLRERNGLPVYMPSVELYHFERQSMPGEDDQVDRGSTIYNRALHTMRWSDQIEAANASVAELFHEQ